MRIILTATNEAAPRACDLCPYHEKIVGKGSPSNIGRKVVLRGLVSRQDLNGCYATVVDEPRLEPFASLFARQSICLVLHFLCQIMFLLKTRIACRNVPTRRPPSAATPAWL
jgi:hypothetical protein